MHKIRKFWHFDAIQSLPQSWWKSEPCSPTFWAQNVSKFTRIGRIKFQLLIYLHTCQISNITGKIAPPPPPLQATNSEGFKGTCYHFSFDQKCFKSSET